MSERRHPSDTLRLARDELARIVAASVEDEAPTRVECPACAGRSEPDAPRCATCGGDGMVTLDAWRAWCASHGGQRFVRCPKCLGEGRHPEIVEKGRWHEVRCSLCDGHKTVRGNLAAAFERSTQEASDDE